MSLDNPHALLDKLNTLAAAALVHWGKEGAQVELIKHRENAVYKVTDDAGQKFVLRVHRLDYHSGAALVSECQWTRSLAKYGVSTTPIIPTLDGATHIDIAVPGLDQPRQCDLLGWVFGAPLGSIEDGVVGNAQALETNYHTIGQIAAQVHNHADQWNVPSGFERHAWDVDAFTGETPLWGRYWEWKRLSTAEQELFQTARVKLRRDLEAFGQDKGKFGLIHADLLPENFLVDGDDINLIDFDDGGFGWRLYDIATAVFFHLGEDNFDAILDALIAGYRKHRDLPDEHLAYLPAFLVARGLSICGWAHSRGEPDDIKDIIENVHVGVVALLTNYVDR